MNIEEYEKMNWKTPSDELEDAVENLVAEVKKLREVIRKTENLCTHNYVTISDFEINGINVSVTIQCDRCGETQQQTLDIEQIIWDLELGWID